MCFLIISLSRKITVFFDLKNEFESLNGDLVPIRQKFKYLMFYFITNDSYVVIIGFCVMSDTLYYIPYFELYNYCIFGRIGDDIMTLVTCMSHSLLFDYPYHNLESAVCNT